MTDTKRSRPAAAPWPRDRLLALTAVAAVALLCWAYIVWLATGMRGGPLPLLMAMPRMQAWSAPDFLLMFLMWAAMMAAMMTPSAAPMVLLYLAVHRKRGGGAAGAAKTAAILGGYLAVWLAFSGLATVVQWALHATALLLDPMGAVVPSVGATILVGAGVFQFTDVKHACLARCRSPLDVLFARWRPGAGGALRMGLRHGLYCLGCCWVLMGVLLTVGIMNLAWIAGLSVAILLERASPWGIWVSRAVGTGLIGWGAWLALAVT